MKKICLQAGHWNTTTSSTGAPNEMSFNIDIAFTVASELRNRGFEVKVTDYNAYKDPEVISVDWDLFLSIHYDADIYGTGGGFVDYPEPSTDGATQESQRIAYLLRQEYFGTTGIVSHPERSNRNTRYYYLWKYLTAKTPCNLIECGVGMHVPDDWEILHFNRPLVVEALTKGICKAFGVKYDPETTTTSTTTSSTTTTSTTSTTVTTEPPQSESSEAYCCEKLKTIKNILYGKGWWWVKWGNIKQVLPYR